MARQNGFLGGVQNGTSATSPSSKGLEQIVRTNILDKSEGVWRSGYSGEQLKKQLDITSDIELAGCYPDGGIFLDKNGNPEISFECKYQGDKGNAIERWYKNYSFMRKLGVKKYVTFCLGEGFFNNNTAERIINGAALQSDISRSAIWGLNDTVFAEFHRFETVEKAAEEIPAIMSHILNKKESE